MMRNLPTTITIMLWPTESPYATDKVSKSVHYNTWAPSEYSLLVENLEASDIRSRGEIPGSLHRKVFGVCQLETFSEFNVQYPK